MPDSFEHLREKAAARRAELKEERAAAEIRRLQNEHAEQLAAAERSELLRLIDAESKLVMSHIGSMASLGFRTVRVITPNQLSPRLLEKFRRLAPIPERAFIEKHGVQVWLIPATHFPSEVSSSAKFPNAWIFFLSERAEVFYKSRSGSPAPVAPIANWGGDNTFYETIRSGLAEMMERP